MKFHTEYKKRLYKRIKIAQLSGVILDLGCGDGEDANEISKKAKKVYAFDIEKNETWKKYKGHNIVFSVADAHKIPFNDQIFDGVFIKDVLHHVKDPKKVLREVKRVTKKGAKIIIVEGNRYNPIFYVHMTKMLGHEHLTQKQFKQMIAGEFPESTFDHFESHFYPTENRFFIFLMQSFERVVNTLPFFRPFLSYNLAIIQK